MNGIAPSRERARQEARDLRVRPRRRPRSSAAAPSPTGALLDADRAAPCPRRRNRARTCTARRPTARPRPRAAARPPRSRAAGTPGSGPSRPSSRNASATVSAAWAAASLPAVRGPIRPASASTRFTTVTLVRVQPVRARPKRLDRLPQQYFVALLGRVAAAAAAGGPPLVDLGRGNPEVGPPPHVVEALAETAARRRRARLRADPRARRAPKEAIAARYRDVYGVDLDPEREVAVVPGTKTAIIELALVARRRGRPDPAARTRSTRTIRPARRSPGARLETVPLRRRRRLGARPRRRRPTRRRSTSTTRRTRARSAPPRGIFEGAVALGRAHGRRGRARRRLHRPRLRRPRARRASSRRPARRTSASRCGRCRRPTAWRAGASASSSATPRSSSASTS